MKPSFSIDPDESVPHGLIRVMDGLVARLQGLAAETSGDVDAYAHKARVCCKRMRAALRLCRPMIGKAQYQRHDRWWRDAARGLSQLRDLAARSEALTVLSADIVPIAGAGAVESAKVRFAAERLETGELDAPQAINRFSRALDQAPRIRATDLGESGGADVLRALGKTYRDARRAMNRAFASGEVEHFHDWRKLTKQHALQAKLLRKVYPDLAKRVVPARELAEALGRLQDISVVLDGLSRPSARAQVRADDRLKQALDSEMRRMMEAAREPGEELFRRKRRSLERALKAHQARD